MKRETLRFDECIIEITLVDNIVYMKTLIMYNDDAAIKMTKYLDDIITQMPPNHIRIWDATDLPSECFQLTSGCVQKVLDWSNKIKTTKPGSQAYFIAPETLIYGVSRMYEMQAEDDKMDVNVLKSLDELPKEINDKIPYDR